MKNYNWILTLLSLVAFPLNATTVDATHDTDSILSKYMDDGDDSHEAKQKKDLHDKPYTKNDHGLSGLSYPLHRLKQVHRKNQFTEGFKIEEAGTYLITMEDIHHETLPNNFEMEFTEGYDHHNLDFEKNEEGFLFDAMPGEYEISIWANGHHRKHWGVAKVYITAVDTSPVPVPPAVWLFGSGLLGLVGIARRRQQ